MAQNVLYMRTTVIRVQITCVPYNIPYS